MAVDIRKPLKRFAPHLIAARDQNLNEADIVVPPTARTLGSREKMRKQSKAARPRHLMPQ